MGGLATTVRLERSSCRTDMGSLRKWHYHGPSHLPGCHLICKGNQSLYVGSADTSAHWCTPAVPTSASPYIRQGPSPLPRVPCDLHRTLSTPGAP